MLFLDCGYIFFATPTITTADGTNKYCEISVPANLLATSHTTARRNCDSSILPSMTSSVMPDMCGSMKTAIMMVAPPLMIDDRVLEVTRTLGSSTPAYNAAV